MEAALAFRNLGNTTKPSINQFFYQGKKNRMYKMETWCIRVKNCLRLVIVVKVHEVDHDWGHGIDLRYNWPHRGTCKRRTIIMTNLSMSGILEANSDTHKENVWRSSANHIYSAWMQLSRSYLKLSNYELVIQICIIHRLLLYVLYMCVRLTMNQNKLGWT